MSEFINEQSNVKAKWTILVYMNGKNDLQDMMLQNWNEMAETGSTQEVKVVVQMGRRTISDTPDGPHYWTGVKRFLVKKGMACTVQNQLSDLQDAGLNTDMGSVGCFTEFLAWGKKVYPAERTMVIIWDHGQGWRYFSSSFDDVTQHCLYNVDVKNAIKNTFGQIDVLCFDACLMAMLEPAYEFCAQVKYMVASEDVTPGTGCSYKFLHQLCEDPACDGPQLGRYITDSYAQKHLYTEEISDDEKSLITMSVLDLSVAEEAVSTLDKLTQVIRKDPASISIARIARNNFTTFDNNLSTSLDLLAWIEYMISHCAAQSPLCTALIKTEHAFQKMVHYCYSNKINHDYVINGRKYNVDARGVAIFFPENVSQQNTSGRFRNGYYRSNEVSPVAFVKKSLWPQFLHDIWHIDQHDTWTVLIYLNGQNDREPHLQNTWNEIAQAGSDEYVNVVVQMGRVSHSDPANGWTGAKRFLMKKGMLPLPLNQVMDLGESGLNTDMNNSASLSDFVHWGKQTYPAGRTMLIVWDACGKEHHTLYNLVNDKLDYISIHKALNGMTVDVLGFDRNGMARLEALYELRSCAPWIVASESVMPKTGWNYAFLQQLGEKPSSTEPDVGNMILAYFKKKYSISPPGVDSANKPPATLSFLRSSLIGNRHFDAVFNKFIDVVLAAPEHIDIARGASRNVPGCDDETTGVIDLLSWVEYIELHCDKNSPLHEGVKALQSLLTPLVAGNYCGQNTPEGTNTHGKLPLHFRGISAFLPENAVQLNRDEANKNLIMDASKSQRPAAFSKAIHWSLLLQKISR